MRPSACAFALLAAIPALASERCAKCHPVQTEGYAKTGMANSIGRPVSQPSGTFRHAPSRSRMEISSGRAGMRHRLERNGLVADYAIDYFIGSGNQGRSYLINVAGRLFQSPASWYTERNAWAVSPGFDAEEELDFDRPIGPDCLFCHSGAALPIPFTLNTYQDPPFRAQAITCERCHGPSHLHVAKPSSRNIVNPAKLNAVLRDAVCDQCHLGGEARILNPGRQFSDYKPGEPLEDTFTTYVFDSNRVEALKVVSHSEQLAASKCAQQSRGRMWCGTCHDPHRKPSQPAAWYRERCRQCHNPASMSGHKEPAEDCAGCHMPRRQTYDGGHTAFTDHEILARPRNRTSPRMRPVKLRAWREPPVPLSIRNAGLAYISVGERHQSVDHINQGFRLLAEIESTFAKDPAVLTSLGVVLQKKGVPKEAARMFRRVSSLEARDARHRLNLAIALAAAGDTAGAKDALETAIALDPSLRDAYLLLAELSGGSALRRYLQFMPQSIFVRQKIR